MPDFDPDPSAPPVGAVAVRELVTIEQFLRERGSGGAGELHRLLEDIALAGKLIASRTRRAGLTALLGKSGETNVQGEEQAEMDVYADDVMAGLLGRSGRVAAVVSEEREEPTVMAPDGRFVVVHDPLDGSSNIDSNVSIGTIFGVYERDDPTAEPSPADWLRAGHDLVAAGYVLYGTSTMFAYSTGDGVHSFTLDPEVGEFILTWSDMTFPDEPAYFSLNLAWVGEWDPGVERFVEWIRDPETPTLTQRYIGSAVADIHRNLLHGGIFGYPGERERPEGKLRLVYEAAPMAWLAREAGGRGSDGHRDLLDIVPEHVHQRTPVFIGNTELIDELEAALRSTSGVAGGAGDDATTDGSG